MNNTQSIDWQRMAKTMTPNEIREQIDTLQEALDLMPTLREALPWEHRDVVDTATARDTQAIEVLTKELVGRK